MAGAARRAGVTRRTVYRYRDEHADFAEEWDDAVAEACAALEGEAKRRGFDGYERPIYQRGQLVGYETVYSDALLSRLLGAHHPAYRSRLAVSGDADGAPIRMTLSESDAAVVEERIAKVLAARAEREGPPSPNGADREGHA